jgi:replication factor C subunit 2/4
VQAAAGTGGAAMSRKEKQQENLPWVEKYRPRKVTDVAHQAEVVRVLQRAVETANLPHLLFYGPPGTGKTSTILAMAKSLYSPATFRQRVLELNASDERGINVVRTKIKDFASTAVSSKQSEGYPSPPYKIIILDEADAMTNDAQSALRRTMEQFSTVTRFCIICNYVSRIIQPLASRCAKFRFKPLEAESMVERLSFICEQEEVEAGEEAMAAVVRCSGGDMRKAVTLLQSAHQYGPDGVTAATVYELSSVVPDEEMAALMQSTMTRNFESVKTQVTCVVAAGYPASQILAQVHDLVVDDSALSDKQKGVVMEQIARADDCLADGADDFLQLMSVMTAAMEARMQA